MGQLVSDVTKILDYKDSKKDSPGSQRRNRHLRARTDLGQAAF